MQVPLSHGFEALHWQVPTRFFCAPLRQRNDNEISFARAGRWHATLFPLANTEWRNLQRARCTLCANLQLDWTPGTSSTLQDAREFATGALQVLAPGNQQGKNQRHWTR
jgi:hypothetical protein